MKWYLYAIAAGSPRDLPDGVGRRPVFVTVHRDIGILASDWDGAPPPLSELAVVAHERVVEAAMQTIPVLPLRFGTVLDESLFLAFIDMHVDRIRRLLIKVADKVEVTLKVFVPSGVETRLQGEEPRTGVAYLLQRQRDALRERKRAEYAKGLVMEIESTLTPWITERHHRLVPTAHVLATLNYLIPQSALGAWTQAAADLQARFPDLDFLASGPWPPYHFAEVNSDGGGRSESSFGAASER